MRPAASRRNRPPLSVTVCIWYLPPTITRTAASGTGLPATSVTCPTKVEPAKRAAKRKNTYLNSEFGFRISDLENAPKPAVSPKSEIRIPNSEIPLHLHRPRSKDVFNAQKLVDHVVTDRIVDQQ